MDIPRRQSYCQLPNPANNRTSFRVFQIVEIQLFEKTKSSFNEKAVSRVMTQPRFQRERPCQNLAEVRSLVARYS